MTNSDSSQCELKIGLALSGGGFRATLFHLGVVGALRKSGLLIDVKSLSATSGGSILAAHLVAKWDSYRDDRFDHVAAELVQFCRQEDIRNRVLASVPLLWLAQIACWLPRLAVGVVNSEWEYSIARRLSPTHIFRKRLSRFCERIELRSSMRLSQLPESAPRLYITTTNLSEAAPAYFDRRGFHPRLDVGPEHPQALGVLATQITLADAVVASACFPALFPPVEIRVPNPDAHRQRPPTRTFVSDGGICDNLGLGVFLYSSISEDLDLILVSDATGRPKASASTWLRYAPVALLRTLDVVASFNQASQQDASTRLVTDPVLGNQSKVRFINIDSIHDSHSRIAEDHQRELGSMRTDLDHFTKHEIRSLITHGYFTAIKTLKGLDGALLSSLCQRHGDSEGRKRHSEIMSQIECARNAASFSVRYDPQNLDEKLKGLRPPDQTTKRQEITDKLWWATWALADDPTQAIDSAKLARSLTRSKRRTRRAYMVVHPRHWPVLLPGLAGWLLIVLAFAGLLVALHDLLPRVGVVPEVWNWLRQVGNWLVRIVAS